MPHSGRVVSTQTQPSLQFNHGFCRFHSCAFVNNTVAIYCSRGNFHLTNSRLEGSRVSDAYLGDHASSFRRVVSVNSGQLFSGRDRAAKLQGVLIHNWGRASGPSPALQPSGPGTLQIIDTVFSYPAHNASPAIAYQSFTEFCSLLLSGVAMAGPTGPLLDPSPFRSPLITPLNSSGANPGVAIRGVAHVVPLGDPVLASRQMLLTPDTHFLWTSERPVGRIFDAVSDFGADNLMRRESSGALQACFDAAAAAGGNSVCYLWPGESV